MKTLSFLLVAAIFLCACSEKSTDANETYPQKTTGIYKTPPKSDRSKDQSF